ncbi:hypothetical protein EG68_06577 [Paragonimus skrjabini miyazakii]|uniref:glycerophosphocholine cholinephosphodiesterase n=1 Tax=Paragonimus skrjabini miyazakii TaxID=59628 RepID=A0A8S9YU30_9TREM|nr:hypothetical protein EG68_06577 [Paragonimus skrjabini miyazakii]
MLLLPTAFMPLKMKLVYLLLLVVPFEFSHTVFGGNSGAFSLNTLVRLDNAPFRSPNRTTNPLLILLIDGLRWDLLDQFEAKTNKTLPGFARLKQHGGHVKRITPVFPTECHPNLISMLTGLYPIDHGAIFNQLYDTNRNESFSYHMDERLNRTVPNLLRTKLAQNRKKVHMYHLPICASPIDDSFSCEPYASDRMTLDNLNRTLQQAMKRLNDADSDITVVYYDKLDQLGHLHGPLSNEVLLTELPALDQVVAYLLDQLVPHSRPVSPINLILTSDHGMSEVTTRELLDRFIGWNQVRKVINRGSTVAIWPLPEQYDLVHRRLSSSRVTRFTVYTNTSIPIEWHTGGDLFPPILLVAKPGYMLDSNLWHIDLGHYSTAMQLKGSHGYDITHTDMHIPLFVLGPGIIPGSVYDGSPVDQLHTYSLITTISGFDMTLSSSDDRRRYGPYTALALGNSPLTAARLFTKNMFILSGTISIVAAILCCLVLVVGLLTFYRPKLRSLVTPVPQSELDQKLLQSDSSIA